MTRDRHIALVRMAVVAFERAADAARNAIPTLADYADQPDPDEACRQDSDGVRDDIDRLREMARQWSDWADRLAKPDGGKTG